MKRAVLFVLSCLIASSLSAQPADEILPGWITEFGKWEKAPKGFQGEDAGLRTAEATPLAFDFSGRFRVVRWSGKKSEKVGIYFWRTDAKFGSEDRHTVVLGPEWIQIHRIRGEKPDRKCDGVTEVIRSGISQGKWCDFKLSVRNTKATFMVKVRGRSFRLSVEEPDVPPAGHVALHARHALVEFSDIRLVEKGRTSRTANKKPGKYKIVAKKDVSYANVVRLAFRIQMDGKKTAGELEAICREIIKANPRTNAIAFFFFLPGTDTGGTYTAGKAEWAPFGDWSKAGDVKSGDHSRHKLVVKVGDALE